MSAALRTALTWTLGIDPLMRKEFYGISRRWPTYALRAGYVGLLGIGAGAWWFFMRDRTFGASKYAQVGQQLFAVSTGVQLVLVSLLTILMGSEILQREMRSRTLGLLTMSPLRPWLIALGKWKACVAHAVLLLLAGLPFPVLAVYLGGIGVKEILMANAMILCIAAMCAAASLFTSTLFRSLLASVSLTSLGLVFICCFVNPIFQMVFVVIAASGTARGGFLQILLPILAVAIPLGFCLGLSLLIVFFTALRIRSLAEAEASGPLAMKAVFAHEARAPGFGLAGWAARTGVWDFNPFLWREFRSCAEWGARTWAAVGVALIAFFCFLVLVLVPDLRSDGWLGSVYAMLALVLIISSMTAGSGSFTTDKEEKRWEMLLSTPATSWQMLWAKLVSGLLGVRYTLLLLTGFTVATVFFRRGLLIPPVLGSMTLFSVFILCFGMTVSLYTATTRTAAGVTLLVALSLLVILPCALAILAAEDRSGLRLYEFILRATNPFLHLQWVAGGGDIPWGALAAFAGFYGSLTIASLAICLGGLRRLRGQAA